MAEKDIEEMLREITIGERTQLNGTIHLEAYTPLWKEQFESLKKGIKAALGSSVIRLEHVGSTSVAGLSAKPLIDMVLEVEDSGNESDYVPKLEAIGYTLRIREPKWFQHRLLSSCNYL